LRGGDAGEAALARAAQLAHAQAQGGVATLLDGCVAQAHVAGDRQSRTGLAQARRVQSVLLQQRLRSDSALRQRIGETVDEAHR
jgi:hypothetical protein